MRCWHGLFDVCFVMVKSESRKSSIRTFAYFWIDHSSCVSSSSIPVEPTQDKNRKRKAITEATDVDSSAKVMVSEMCKTDLAASVTHDEQN